jgi:signal transduction histidine kinase
MPRQMKQLGEVELAFAHDLRNPLGTIYAGAEMLMDLDPSPTVKRLAGNIYRAAGRLRDLLAEACRGDRGIGWQFETCDLRDVITTASDTTRTQEVEVLIDAREAIQMPLARSRMELVFVNLIANSVEAMPGGGTVRIVVKRTGNCASIELEDTGPGIPPRIRARLFEPFVTAGKENGLGLGLALCRQTVLDHGGDIWSEPSAAGARFVIRLPLAGC